MPVLGDQTEVAQAEKTRITEERADYVRANMDKPNRELVEEMGFSPYVVWLIQEVPKRARLQKWGGRK